MSDEPVELSAEEEDFLSLSARERTWDNSQRAEKKWPWRAIALPTDSGLIYVMIAHVLMVEGLDKKKCLVTLTNSLTLTVNKSAQHVLFDLGIWP